MQQLLSSKEENDVKLEEKACPTYLEIVNTHGSALEQMGC